MNQDTRHADSVRQQLDILRATSRPHHIAKSFHALVRDDGIASTAGAYCFHSPDSRSAFRVSIGSFNLYPGVSSEPRVWVGARREVYEEKMSKALR